MDSPPPTPLPVIVYNNNDLLAGMSGIAAFAFIILAVRIAHVYMARKSMHRNNYHSKRQWIASLSLNFLSISTGFFTFATIILNIVRFKLGSGNNESDALADSFDVLFYFFYALQNLSYNFWLIARDRALQSMYFQTNVIFVYIAAILSLLSAFCNFTLFSGFIEVERAYAQILGQILQLLILCTMTLLFTRPLLKYALGSWSQTNENIRAVVKRTAVGAVIHVTMTLAFVALILAGVTIIEAIGFVYWYMLLNVCAVIPLMMHISISHRDDKPVLLTIESFRSTSNTRSVNSKSIFQAYMSKAIETLHTESAEVQSLHGNIIGGSSASTDAVSFISSPELEMSADGAQPVNTHSSLTFDATTDAGDSSTRPDQIVVTETYDDTA